MSGNESVKKISICNVTMKYNFKKNKNKIIIVLTTLYPSKDNPNVGIFIRERMLRVAKYIPLIVVAPYPWSPFDKIIRIFKPNYRSNMNYKILEKQDNIYIYRPRFFSIPYLLKCFDGILMAYGCLKILRHIQKRVNISLVDSHFAYPEGFAATMLARWFKVPVTITIRGTEVTLSKYFFRKQLIIKALNSADRVFSVSESLKRHACSLGVPSQKIQVIRNGVDIAKFCPIGKNEARNYLKIPQNSKVLITVGSLVPRKGQHRIISILPELIKYYPNLIYLIVGGNSPEGDSSTYLKKQVSKLKLDEHVYFVGSVHHHQLNRYLSASDLFVLASSNEGLANVLLEAMAVGLPIIATNVGGAQEIINDDVGIVVPFNNSEALLEALRKALDQKWEKKKIRKYAMKNAWDQKIPVLIQELKQLLNQ